MKEKVRPIENRSKEPNDVTDLKGHITTPFHDSYQWERNKD